MVTHEAAGTRAARRAARRGRPRAQRRRRGGCSLRLVLLPLLTWCSPPAHQLNLPTTCCSTRGRGPGRAHRRIGPRSSRLAVPHAELLLHPAALHVHDLRPTTRVALLLSSACARSSRCWSTVVRDDAGRSRPAEAADLIGRRQRAAGATALPGLVAPGRRSGSRASRCSSARTAGGWQDIDHTGSRCRATATTDVRSATGSCCGSHGRVPPSDQRLLAAFAAHAAAWSATGWPTVRRR